MLSYQLQWKRVVARRSGHSVSTVHGIETGDNKNPSFATICNIARVLCIPLETLDESESRVNKKYRPIKAVSMRGENYENGYVKPLLRALAFCLPGRGPVFRPHYDPYAVFIFNLN